MSENLNDNANHIAKNLESSLNQGDLPRLQHDAALVDPRNNALFHAVNEQLKNDTMYGKFGTLQLTSENGKALQIDFPKAYGDTTVTRDSTESITSYDANGFSLSKHDDGKWWAHKDSDGPFMEVESEHKGMAPGGDVYFVEACDEMTRKIGADSVPNLKDHKSMLEKTMEKLYKTYDLPHFE